ncbi:UDP-glycosyltransferase 84B2 [Ricinus communis]|uniref:Glycosyltransferase n=1 Tax=Ricinus communis TaxID=3988 RepID=B9SG12_RICCO|nr:UDP-glycosyltransferase 84B2 [Ricinus communis]EEF37428.1 UDP-glucosyltransferase, putative [Ricinus communis]|eukprot:XP_002524931.1 UDP-glycosyltransferase 84B2 [Ricinus communis]
MVAEEVHFLMVTAAMQGHMNPMLKLAKRLVSKGIYITLATNDVARHRMLNSKVSSIADDLTTAQNATPKPPGITLAFFSDGLSPEFDRDEDVDRFIKSMRTIGARNLSNLITDLIAQDRKFSCVILNPFFPWVADIAAENGIPCATLWIQACSIYSVYYHFLKHPNLFPSLDDPDKSVELPGLPALQVKDLPSFILPTSPPIFYETLLDLVQKLDNKVKWVLVNSFTELEEDVVKSMASLHPIYPIGPLVSPFLLGEEEMMSKSTIDNVDMWRAENSCIAWLDKKPPSSVIYISFGSITVLSQKQMDNLATGLKNSNKPFLWVIKPKPENSETKGGELPGSFLEETKEKGLVVTWCEQEKVLMHKAVGCFITHCGWNSTLESVVAGVPVIAYPGWTDQPTVAKFLVDVLKIGVRVKIEDGFASSEEVERCIMEITGGPEAEGVKKRALELKEAAKKVGAEGGSSDQIIDQFINEITGKPF